MEIDNSFILSVKEICVNEDCDNYYDSDFIEVSCVVDGDIINRENLLLKELNEALTD